MQDPNLRSYSSTCKRQAYLPQVRAPSTRSIRNGGYENRINDRRVLDPVGSRLQQGLGQLTCGKQSTFVYARTWVFANGLGHGCCGLQSTTASARHRVPALLGTWACVQ